MSATTTTRRPQAGPPLVVPAVATTVLTIAGAITFAGGPRPDTSPAATLAYLRDHQGLINVAAFLIFATSLPLAVFSAAAYRRLRRLGVTAPGSAIAFAGGLLASASLAVSGLIIGVAGRAADHTGADVSRVLIDLSFGTGGIGFAAPLALLVAGVAVPALLLGLAPRPLAWLGLVLAAAGAVATLGLLTDALYPVLPVVRFGGLLWLIAMSIVLPTGRPREAADR